MRAFPGLCLLLLVTAALPARAAETDAPAASNSARAPRLGRPFVLGEFGWNGLAGAGVIGGYHLLPHLTVEAGGGFSLLKWKVGARVRGNLWDEAEWTPFAAAGLQYGFGDAATEATFSISGNRLRYVLSAAPFAQLVAGVDFTGDDGVTFQASAGWAFRLRDNLQLTDGVPSATQQQLLGLAFGSGPVLSAAVGYTF